MTTEQQELFARADNFVTTMIPLADQTRPYAMWYGWALNEAWRVGYAAGRAAQAEQTSGKAADVPRTQPDDAESPGPLDPIADLCARLRDEYEGCPSPVTTARVATLREAADALERLRAERAEAERDTLRKCLKSVVSARDDDYKPTWYERWQPAIDAARAKVNTTEGEK